jgi:hypothetical protein
MGCPSLSMGGPGLFGTSSALISSSRFNCNYPLWIARPYDSLNQRADDLDPQCATVVYAKRVADSDRSD